MIGRVLSRTANPVAVTGHLATGDVGRGQPRPLAAVERPGAARARASSTAAGVADARIARVTGKADRSPVIADDPRDPRNRRIEITLLRSFEP